jgi:hypothetical protein
LRVGHPRGPEEEAGAALTKRLALAVVVAALAAGCGSDDEGEKDSGGTPEPAATATIGEDALIDGDEGREIAAVALELLNSANGDDPCYAIAASDYVESLGGLDGCAKELGPIATGPYDTVLAAGPKDDGETATADVADSDGGEKRTIEFAKSVSTDKWNIDGLKD